MPSSFRTYFELYRLDWRHVPIDPGGIEFNLPISGWFRLFRDTGFEVLDYLELRAPEGCADRFNMPAAWARRWPAEHVWKLRRPGRAAGPARR
jgi:hypothetical protein